MLEEEVNSFKISGTLLIIATFMIWGSLVTPIHGQMEEKGKTMYKKDLTLFLHQITHEKKSFSDHCPLTMECCLGGDDDCASKRRLFKFEEAWTKEPKCEKIVERVWKKGSNALENISNIKTALLGSDIFNLKKSRRRIKELEEHMEKIQRAAGFQRGGG